MVRGRNFCVDGMKLMLVSDYSARDTRPIAQGLWSEVRILGLVRERGSTEAAGGATAESAKSRA